MRTDFDEAQDKIWTFQSPQAVVGQWLATFKEFPPSQESATFGIDQVLRQLQQPTTGK